MRKILELTADQFLKVGISANQYSTVGGLFWRAPGCDPFIIPGLLSAGPNPSEIGAGTIAETINVFVQGLASSSYVTMYGEDGGLYRLDLVTDAVTSLRSLSDSQGQDAVMWRGELRYSRNSSLGKATVPDGDGPVFTDDYKQFTNSNVNHPLHVFQGNLYGGDLNVVFLEESSGYTEAKLTLPPDLTIVDIDDDGYYLVIAAVKKWGTAATRVESHLFFWDTISPNFNFEWTLTEGEITSIGKTYGGRTMKAYAGSGLYHFSYADAPQVFIPGSGSTYAPFGTSDLQPARGGLGFWKGQEAWVSNGRFWTYGRVLPTSPKIFACPITLSGIKAFFVNGFSAIFASANDDNLYKASAGNLTPVIETNIISLPQAFDIKAIKLYSGDALTASSSIQVQVTGETQGTITLDETFNSTNSGTSQRSFWRNTGVLRTEYLRVLLTLNGGANFRKLELWGEPVSSPMQSTSGGMIVT